MASALPCIAAGHFSLTPGDGGSPTLAPVCEAGPEEPCAGNSSVRSAADQDEGRLCCRAGQVSSTECISASGERGSGCPTLLGLAADWPELAALRPAASSPNINRLRCALSTFASHTRVEFAAALLAVRNAARGSDLPDESELPALRRGRQRHAAALDLLGAGESAFSTWNMSRKQSASMFAHIRRLVDVGSGLVPCEPPIFPAGDGYAASFPLTVGCFLAALAAGWPWETALGTFALLDRGWFHEDSKVFVSDVGRHATFSGRWLSGKLQLSDHADCLQFFLAGDRIALVISTCCLQPQRSVRTMPVKLLSSGRPSRFLPGYIRLPREVGSDLFDLPAARVTAVVERKDAWLSRLGHLDGTAYAIVHGHFTYPRRRWSFAPSFKRNHPSWEKDAEAKAALGPTIAAWLFSGILEFVPPDCSPPLVIEPVGAVPKSSPPGYRLVTDARISIQDLDEWPVRYWTALEAAAGLRYGALMCADDAKDAYHLSAFAGCTGELYTEVGFTLQPDGSMAEKPLLYLGCSPRSCLGTCDKARSGICLDGSLFRFAAAQFGQKLAGSPLNGLFLPIMRHLSRRFGPRGHLLGIICSLWVDDMMLSQNLVPHGLCGGLLGECRYCQQAAAMFAEGQAYWHGLAADLGVTLSPSKRQGISQRAEYTGVILDTIAGRFYIPEKKLEKLRSSLREMIGSSSFTLLSLASVRGRALHYSICIMYIRPLVPLLAAPPDLDQDDLDRAHPRRESIAEACTTLLDLVDRFSAVGAPMWPLVPSSLYGRFLRRELVDERVIVIIWDSSVSGWGAFVRWWGDFEGKLVACTWGPGEADVAQVHREARGGVRALAAAAQLVNLHGSVVILRNDAVGALSAFRKGCGSSLTLQEAATQFNLQCAALGCEPLFLHAPGRDLVSEGVDGASRELADSLAGPSCSQALKNMIFSIAARHGWTITVDAFASFGNRVVERYFSEYAEPDSEAVDALAVTDWHSSRCPSCGSWHRETLHVFAPTNLLRRFMAKATSDGARALVVVPFSITAFYWRGLLEAALPVNDKGELFKRLRNAADMLAEPGRYSGPCLALFAVDFERVMPHPRRMTLVPGCGQEHKLRGRPPLGHPRDVEDRRRIHEELRRTHQLLLGHGVGEPSPVPSC